MAAAPAYTPFVSNRYSLEELVASKNELRTNGSGLFKKGATGGELFQTWLADLSTRRSQLLKATDFAYRDPLTHANTPIPGLSNREAQLELHKVRQESEWAYQTGLLERPKKASGVAGFISEWAPLAGMAALTFGTGVFAAGAAGGAAGGGAGASGAGYGAYGATGGGAAAAGGTAAAGGSAITVGSLVKAAEVGVTAIGLFQAKKATDAAEDAANDQSAALAAIREEPVPEMPSRSAVQSTVRRRSLREQRMRRGRASTILTDGDTSFDFLGGQA